LDCSGLEQSAYRQFFLFSLKKLNALEMAAIIFTFLKYKQPPTVEIDLETPQVAAFSALL